MSTRIYLVLALLLVPALPAWGADYVYATSDVNARRFQDVETPSAGEIKTNDKLRVIFRSDDWVRVRLSAAATFGWIPGELTSVEAPESVATEPGAGINTLTDEQKATLQEMFKSQGAPTTK